LIEIEILPVFLAHKESRERVVGVREAKGHGKSLGGLAQRDRHAVQDPRARVRFIAPRVIPVPYHSWNVARNIEWAGHKTRRGHIIIRLGNDLGERFTFLDKTNLEFEFGFHLFLIFVFVFTFHLFHLFFIFLFFSPRSLVG
jgi:hypothetical protein